MSVLRVIAKILLIPVATALTLLQWIGIFLNSISGVILGVLAFIFALTGIISLAFGLVSGLEALKMIAVGFVIFIIPVTGEWILALLEAVCARVRNYIRS